MRKAFTLIELLVVVAIVAILAIVVVLTINPAELLRQGRDATRVSDMSTLNKAVALYYQGAMDNPSTMFMGTSSIMYISIPDPVATSTAGDQCQGLGLPALPTGYTYQCAASSTYMKVDGTGWIPINFNSYVAGSVLSKLPVDPVNTTSTNLYYTYETDGIGGFKVAAFFESQKDASQMASDGGNDPELYEKGSNLALANGRGLIGYWPMDEGSGTTFDDFSGNGQTGTIYGGLAWGSGKVGASSIISDGSSTEAIPNNSAGLEYKGGNMSVVIWINPDASDDGGFIISKPWNGSGQYNYYLNDTGGANPTFSLTLTGATGYRLTSRSMTAGNWHQIAFVLNSANSVIIYIDGTVSASGIDIISNWTPSLGDNNLKLVMGCVYPYGVSSTCAGNSTTDFKGSMDDARVYNRALSAAEIQEMYNAEK